MRQGPILNNGLRYPYRSENNGLFVGPSIPIVFFPNQSLMPNFQNKTFIRHPLENHNHQAHRTPLYRVVRWPRLCSTVHVEGRFMKYWTRYGLNVLACVAVLGTAGCISLFNDRNRIPDGMVLIPGGTNAGKNPPGEVLHSGIVYPDTYNLTVESFYMDATHVTKLMWENVYTWAKTNGYRFDNAGSGNAPHHPVHSVNWYDVVKWCNARSEMEGLPAVYTVNGAVYRTGQENDVIQTSAAGYRLPTSTEWEYAARGGLIGQRFPWGDRISHINANYRASADGVHSYEEHQGYAIETYHPAYRNDSPPRGWIRDPYTSPVGSFAANAYGLHDMAGNLLEWCFDWFPELEDRARVLRGGSWNSTPPYCRVGNRNYGAPRNTYPGNGFRTVLSR